MDDPNDVTAAWAAEQQTITWDRPKLERFKSAFAKSTGGKMDVFTFDGVDFVKGYAKYYYRQKKIAYLEERLSAAS
jgi:hypothetical protein